MLNVFLTALGSVLTLFVFVAGGWVMRKRGMVDARFSAQLSKVLFNFFLPCLMLKIVLFDFDASQLQSNCAMIFVSVSVLLAAIPISMAVRGLFKGRVELAPLQFALMFSNYIFMGLPICLEVLGGESSFTVVMYTLPIHLLVSTLGYMILASRRKIDWRALFNPCTIAILIGFVLVALNVAVPDMIENALYLGAGVVSPMAMFTVGLIIGGFKLADLGDLRDSIVISAIRLIALPVLLFGVLYLCGMRGFNLSVPVLIAAMPVAANMTISAGSIGRHEQISAQVVFISTLCSLVTLPFVACLSYLA